MKNYTYEEKILPLALMARAYGLDNDRLKYRLNHSNWTIEQAIRTPLFRRKPI